MLKFFRKIRHNHIMENPTSAEASASRQTSKYFKYAIGEIILVVFGILIALQINNWNESRINKKQEQQILLQLKSEYEENLREIDNKIAMRNDIVNASHRLLSIKEGILKAVPADTIARDLFRICSTPTFNPVIGTTNELLSSGKLYLINNNKLKSILTNWSGKTERLTEYEQDLRNYYNTQFDPYLSEKHSIKDLFNGFRTSNLLNFEKKDKSEIVKALLEDSEIDDYIVNIASLCAIAEEDALIVRNDIEIILSLVNKEIRK